MNISRRQLLLISSAGIAGLAGCEETEVNTPADQDDSDGSNSDGSSGDGSSGDGSSGDGGGGEDQNNDGNQGGTFELGQTAKFSVGEDTTINFTPTSAILHEALIYASSGLIFSEIPESSDRLFLAVEIVAENTGGESFRPPSSIVFTTGGTQYDTTFTSTYSDSSFAQYSEIQPGASRTGWVVFEIPSGASEGSLVAEFQTISGSATGVWSIDLSNVDRQTLDIKGLSLGETAEIGTDRTSYSVAAVSAEETQLYDYSSGDYEFTQEAGEGMKYVLVTVQASNTGERAVSIPGSFQMSLISGNSQYDADLYRDTNDAYEGGEISSGITREGIVQFEVPQSASSYTFQVNLTQDLTATWEF